MKRQISLVVTDLDNTLYDWVTMWYEAFTAMIEQLVARSGLPRSVLEPEIQAIFQKHGTSEYSFLIEEIPSLRAKHPGEELTVIYSDAITAYRTARDLSLRLYPGVSETLKKLKRIGCLVVGFTESMEFYVMLRVKQLGLDGLLDYVYSLPDHEKPSRDLTHWRSNSKYGLQDTVQRFLHTDERKPAPSVLLRIISDDGIQTLPENTVYVGDSLPRDIRMAQDAGIIDVHAKYGTAEHTEAYNVLRRVTHWTKEDVERERRMLADGTIVPTYVLEHSFQELLDLFAFVRHSREQSGKRRAHVRRNR